MKATKLNPFEHIMNEEPKDEEANEEATHDEDILDEDRVITCRFNQTNQEDQVDTVRHA